MSLARWRYRIPQWLRRVFRVRDIERDLDDEIRDHVESQTAANIANGMPPHAARRAALVAFGGVERVKDESRDVRRVPFVEGFANLRHAARALRRAPAYTLACVATIALAVGAGSTVFTLVDTVLLRPLPYPESDRLVGLWHTFPGIGLMLVGQAEGTYLSYRSATQSFESIGAYGGGVATVEVPGSSRSPDRLNVSWVTASLFQTLKAHPIVGRLFNDADERGDAHLVAVLSEPFWRTHFNADPNVAGHTLRVDGINTEILGVLPASFSFPRSDVGVWVTFTVPRIPYLGSFYFRAVGRLRPGVTPEAARAELQRILMRVAERYPEQRAGVSTAEALRKAHAEVVLRRLRDDAIGSVARNLWLVAGVVALLGFVALGNIASLTLARVEARQRELAVRVTLGASRMRVWWILASESAIVSIAGGVVGTLLGSTALTLLGRLGPTSMPDPIAGGDSQTIIPRLVEVHPDAVFVATAIVLTVAFCVVAMSIGAWRLASADAARLVREGGRAGTGSRGTQRTRSVLVAADVALSFVLLAGTGVLARSLIRLSAIRPGFDTENVLTFGTSAPPWIYVSGVQVRQFYRRALEAAQQIDGVESAAFITKLPLAGWWGALPIFADDAALTGGGMPPITGVSYVGGEYFATMRIPIVTGRSFLDEGFDRGNNEAVVSRAFSKLYWNDPTGARALGKRIRSDVNGPWYTIVGIVGDVRDTALTSPPPAKVYFPGEGRNMFFAVRTRGAVPRLARSLERAIHSVDPSAPFSDVHPMAELVSNAGIRLRFILLLLGVGAIATLTLGVVGLYGVVAYVVGFRAREIGIRIALGLQPNRAVTMIVRQGFVVIGTGVVVGILAFVGFSKLLRAVAFDVSVVDAASLAIAAGVVLGISMIATWAPARRAGRIDPAEALKSD